MMGNADMDLLQFINEYLSDVANNLKALEGSMAELRKDMALRDELSAMAMAMHNLKGASGVIGFHDVETICRRIEGFIEDVREKELPVSGPMLDLIAEAAELARSVVMGHATGGRIEWSARFLKLRQRMDEMTSG